MWTSGSKQSSGNDGTELANGSYKVAPTSNVPKLAVPKGNAMPAICTPFSNMILAAVAQRAQSKSLRITVIRDDPFCNATLRRREPGASIVLAV